MGRTLNLTYLPLEVPDDRVPEGFRARVEKLVRRADRAAREEGGLIVRRGPNKNPTRKPVDENGVRVCAGCGRHLDELDERCANCVERWRMRRRLAARAERPEPVPRRVIRRLPTRAPEPG